VLATITHVAEEIIIIGIIIMVADADAREIIG